MQALNSNIDSNYFDGTLTNPAAREVVRNVFATVSSSTKLRTRSLIPELSTKAKNAISKIKSFKNLKEDWDSYKANIISHSAIENAINFIKKIDKEDFIQVYFVAPVPDGGVLCEYKNNNGESAEIYFNFDGFNEIVIFDSDNEVILEGELDKELVSFKRYMHE